MSKYVYTDKMDEISGFGGGYEDTCRAMVIAGLEWWDDNPDADPVFKGFKDVYGIIMDENDDAKALSKAVLDGSGGDCTGAMHQATISHIMVIRKEGWDWYVNKMEEENETSDM